LDISARCVHVTGDAGSAAATTGGDDVITSLLSFSWAEPGVSLQMLVSYETTKKHDYVTTVTYTYTDYSLTVARCVQLNLLLSFSSHHSAHRQS